MAKVAHIPSRIVRWRGAVQAAFALLWLGPFVPRLHSICSPVFHCYACPLATFACPIGVIANFSALHVFPFIAVGTLIVAGGLFGGFICGWACPFGFFQDLIGKIPTPKFRLPSWTGNFRYAVLFGLVLVIPFLFGEAHPLFICRICPAGALEAAIPNVVRQSTAAQDIYWPNPLKITFLVLILSAMFLSWRPWCSLFCPLGAVFGIFNRVSAVFLRVNHDGCNSCGICRKICRYGVLPDKGTTDPRCISCLDCTRCEAITVGSIFRRPKPGAGGGEAQEEPVETPGSIDKSPS